MAAKRRLQSLPGHDWWGAGEGSAANAGRIGDGYPSAGNRVYTFTDPKSATKLGQRILNCSTRNPGENAPDQTTTQ